MHNASKNLSLHLTVLLEGCEDCVAAVAVDVYHVLLCNTDNKMQNICKNVNDASLVLATNAGGGGGHFCCFAINFGTGWEVVDALCSASGGKYLMFVFPPLTIS